MTYINSNLTNREAYALHGKLDDARMEELLILEDAHNILEEEIGTIQANIEAAKEILNEIKDEHETAPTVNILLIEAIGALT